MRSSQFTLIAVRFWLVRTLPVLSLAILAPWTAHAGVIEYGDENLLNTGSYSSDPKAGATLVGLTANSITDSTGTFGHGFPFSPDAGDYPGTDQIYVGSNQTGAHDGYSQSAQRIPGPQVISMDYSSLVPAGQVVNTLTLGIASDDFQNTVFGQPFLATLNGLAAPALTTKLNSLNETGPVEHFFTIGVDPSILSPTNQLVLSIGEGGDGGDGWAVDFLTVGVTTSPVPEPSVMVLACVFAAGLFSYQWRQRRRFG
jgi:hypothetical protein